MNNFSNDNIKELLPKGHVSAPIFDLSQFQSKVNPIEKYDSYKIPVYNAHEFDIQEEEDNYQTVDNNIQLKMEPHEYKISNQQTNDYIQ